MPSNGFTLITASHIQDASGEPLASGRVTFYPVSSSGAPVSAISGGTSGGGAISQAGVVFLVVNGAITTDLFGNAAKVADTTLTSPVNIAYRVTITDAAGVDVQGPGYGLVQPSGSTFNFDTYVPYQPLSLTLNPPISLAIGSVTEGSAAVTVTGVYPAFTLNFVLPGGGGGSVSYPSSLVFVDTVTGSHWSYSISGGEQILTPVSSSVAATSTATVLIDTVTGQHYQLAFVSGAFERVPVSSSVAGVSQIVLDDATGSGQWILSITSAAFGITPTNLTSGQLPGPPIDGATTSFSVASAPRLGLLFRNGLFMTPGVDYNMTSSSTFTYTFVPGKNDTHYFV